MYNGFDHHTDIIPFNTSMFMMRILYDVMLSLNYDDDDPL